MAEKDRALEGLLTVLAGEVGKMYSYVWQNSPVVPLQEGGRITPSSRRQSQQEPPAYEEIVRR